MDLHDQRYALKKEEVSVLKRKTPFTLVFITLSQPLIEYCSSGSPHEAPALLTRISSPFSL